jgi:glycerophosphoryl diester phosphodiesterase
MKKTFFSGPQPRIFAHRGSSGNMPENTLISFQTALEEGADILEMDVHATRDGEILVLHDPELSRTTDGKGQVSELTFKQVRRLDAGFRFTPDAGKTFPSRGKGIRIPTLREVAERFPDVPFNIEIKQSEPGIEREVFKLLETLGHAALVLLAAESDSLMDRIRRVSGPFPTNFASSEVLEFLQRVNSGKWEDYTPPSRALQIPEKYHDIVLVSRDSLEAAHHLGIEVHVWTVNEENDMSRLLKMGVDGVMTDFPGRLKKVIEEVSPRA